MYKFRETNYEKKYIKRGGGDDVDVFYCIPDTELGKFLNLETHDVFCFGKLGDALKDNKYYPVLFSESESISFCEKVVQTYKSNWSVSGSFCVFGMLILKFKINGDMISSIEETSFEQEDASMFYDSTKMTKPLIKYKAQSSENRHGLISCEMMDGIRNSILDKSQNKNFEVYYHVDDELNKSCFAMFNLLSPSFGMTVQCLNMLQILYKNKNKFINVNNDQSAILTRRISLKKSVVPLLTDMTPLPTDATLVAAGGKRKSKKYSNSKKHSNSKKDSKSKKHSKSNHQKGGKTEIKMKKQYNDLVKEYYALKKQARSKNII
jgi:hypothetical protein